MCSCCSNVQTLKNKRLLEKGEMQLRVGNGASIDAVTVGDLDLHLPNGLILELSSIYFVPSISRNIISVSCMDMDGFTFSIKDQYFSFYRDGIFYGSSQVVNGLYVLEMDNQVLNINNMRLKSSRESEILIWHHRLGHINETRIKKLQDIGLLGCFDLESITTCESCLSGKMTKTPFTKKSERSMDLLGLVHSDVCSPMSISARDGSRYFVTFTDNFSRYGYVYLMSKAELSRSFWGFALETTIFMLNRVPSKSVERTPYELWFGRIPNVYFIKIWGYEAYIKRLMSDKLSPRSDKCIFVGYLKETKGYYFYYKSENKIVVARHAVFLEKEFLARGSSGSNVQLEEIQITHESDIDGDFTIPSMDVKASGSWTSKLSSHGDENVVQDTSPQGIMEEASEPHALRRSSRSSHPPERWLGLHQGSTCDAEDPFTYMEAMVRSDSVEWLGAMRSEIQSMYDNQV
jgi:GAG-pre-integrase domain